MYVKTNCNCQIDAFKQAPVDTEVITEARASRDTEQMAAILKMGEIPDVGNIDHMLGLLPKKDCRAFVNVNYLFFFMFSLLKCM